MKTIAKPVASRIKVEAKKHPRFSSLCISLGQFTHQITSRLNVLASGYKIIGVSSLPEEEALSRGINFLSETFVFSVAGTIIVVEYARSEAKNAEKAKKAQEAEQEFRQYLEDKFTHLTQEIAVLQTRVEELDKMSKLEVESSVFILI